LSLVLRAVDRGQGFGVPATSGRLCAQRAACRVLPPALLHLIVLARARARIGRLGVPIALEKEAEAVVAPVVAARNPDIDRRPPALQLLDVAARSHVRG
jgi:hypothetical protein